MKTRHLFVYGSLRRDMPTGKIPAGGSNARADLARWGRYVGSARIRGQLVDLGSYPALVDGAGWVTGDLYESAAMEELIAALDIYEESISAVRRANSPNEYFRTRRRVLRADGSPADAFVYVYNHPAGTRPPIPAGDYLAWLTEARRAS